MSASPLRFTALPPLERLQLLVPGGFRGYKIKDLIRQDDFLVRQAIVQSLEEAARLLEEQAAEKAMEDPLSAAVQEYERLLSELRSLTLDIKSAPMGGDSGMHDRFKLFPEDLEKIVQYDLGGLVNAARAILDGARARREPAALIGMIRELRNRFNERSKLLIPGPLR